MTKPRILIDASVVTSIPDGLSTYVVSLLKHLPEESFERFDYSLLVNPGLEREDFWAAIEGRPFRIVEARMAAIGPRRDWHMYRFLKARGGEFDLIHNTSNSFPLAMRGGVCTIHDVTFKRWFHNPRGIPGARHAAAAYLSAAVRHCLRRAQAIISVSHSTRDEIARLFHPSPAQLEKIIVIHEGWEHLQGYAEEEPSSSERPDVGYIFFLGSFRRHKNLERLLEAFALAADRIPAGKKLVISGSSNRLSPAMQRRVEDLNRSGERVVFTGYVSNARVRRYYEQADAFIFPSLAEGFGIPVLEAFYYGTPLLCSRTTSLPEVAGPAALYFNPFDAHDIARAIVEIYGEPGLREKLVALGRERLQAFSWSSAARETVAVYERCLASSPAPRSR